LDDEEVVSSILTGSTKLTLANLVNSAQRAVFEGRLGIQIGKSESRSVYDGSVCAIAACFPSWLLRRIEVDEVQRGCWLALKRAGYFDVDCIDTIEALATFQLGYDFCCVQDIRVQTERAAQYLAMVLSLGTACSPTCTVPLVPIADISGFRRRVRSSVESRHLH
jgi:hypothetical protein